MNEIGYSYAETNRLEDRNTYFYSNYAGYGFLDCYFKMRRAIVSEQIARIPVPVSNKEVVGVTEQGVDTNDLLRSLTGMLHENRMSQEAWGLVAKIIQRFEVSKRLHPGYGPEWRPLEISDYCHLDLYLWFARLMEASYACRGGLPELNALLKVVDSLISVRHLLSPDQKSLMAWLIQREMEIVREMSDFMEPDRGA